MRQVIHTIVAVAPKQDLLDMAKANACCPALIGQFDLLHTRDATTIDADKVWVRSMPQLLFRDDLKSPDMIT